MNLIQAFESAYQQKAKRGWDCIYAAVDIHGTIFKPTYSPEENYDYYPFAKEALQMMSRRHDVKLILWSSSHHLALTKYWDKLNGDGIFFNFINENPDVHATELAAFCNKFYFNVGLDDKFGFEPETDWFQLRGYFLEKAVSR